MNLNIYQYEDPEALDPVENAVWIAAAEESQANALAEAHGWTPAGGLIFTPQQHQCEDSEQLIRIGVDVVIEGAEP